MFLIKLTGLMKIGNESLKEKIKQFGDFMTDSLVSISSKDENKY